MTRNLVAAGMIALCLSGDAYAATRHAWRHRSSGTQTVDVAASPLPPPPSNASHVRVVNSAQSERRHHGIAGAAQRLHQWHMRTRARLYKSLFAR